MHRLIIFLVVHRDFLPFRLQLPETRPREEPTGQILEYIEALKHYDILCVLLVPNLWILEDWAIHSPNVS